MRYVVRLLLFQLVPYVALCAWILTFDDIQLPRSNRVWAIVLITLLWLFISGARTPYDGKPIRRGPVRPPRGTA
jgi:hypothetical protein